MAFHQIEWKSSAKKELKRLDRSVIPRVVEAIGQLSQEPFPPGCRKLQGSESTYRLRVGEYRVVYEIVQGRFIVEIIRVRHRKDAYR